MAIRANETPPRDSRLFAEDVQGWWGEAARDCYKRKPFQIPNIALCRSLTACILDAKDGVNPNADFARSHANYKKPTPITDALNVAQKGALEARERWGAKLIAAPSDPTPPFVIARLDALLTAMGSVYPDWLEDQIVVSLLPWQATASFLYPKAASTWREAGNTPSKPHGKDPVCAFLYIALDWIGCKATGRGVSTISDFLLKSGAASIRRADDYPPMIGPEP